MSALNVGSAFATFSLKLQGVKKSAQKATASMARIEKSAKSASASVHKSAKSASASVNKSAKSASAGVQRSAKSASAGVQRSAKSIKGSFANIENASRKMRKVGLVMGAVVGAIGIGAVKTAMSFESAFTGVEKTIDGTSEQMKSLRKDFEELSLRVPKSFEELAAIGEISGQLGIARESVVDFTEIIAALGETTNLTGEQAAVSIARIGNIMGVAKGDMGDFASRLGSTLVDLGNNFATTESEINEFAMRISGAGKIAGLTSADIAGIGTAMSSVGVQAEAGGTAVQKVLNTMTQSVATGDDKLKHFAETAGISATKFQDLFKEDPSEAFVLFTEGLSKAGDDAFGILEKLSLKDQRLIRSFLGVAQAGGLLREAIDVGNKAFEENTALTEEAAKRYDDMAQQVQLAKNGFRKAAKEVGVALMPAFKSLLETVTPIIKRFGTWAQENPKLVKIILGVTAAIAALLIVLGTLGLIIGPIAAGFAALMSPIGLIILGIIASIAQFYLLWKAWKFIINKIKSVFKGLVSFFKTGDLSGEFLRALGVHEDGKIVAFLFFIRESFMAMKEAIRNIFIGIKESVTGAWTATGNALSATWEFIKTIFRAGVSIILKILSPWIWVVKNIMIPLFQILAMGIKIAFDFIANIISAVMSFIAGHIISAMNVIAGFLSRVWASISASAVAIWTPIKDFFIDIFNIISGFILEKWEKIKAGLIAIWESIKFAASVIWGKIRDALLGPITEANGRLSSKFDDIKNMIGNKVQGWIDIAKEKISGMWGAISGKLTAFKEKIEGWADSIHDAFTRAFDKDEKGSPSVMMNVKDMVDGVNSLIHSGFEMPDIHGRLVEEFDFADVGGNTSNVNITNNNNVGDGVDVNMMAERMAFQVGNTRLGNTI